MDAWGQTSGEHRDELHDVRPLPDAVERVFLDESNDLTAPADHDFGVERQPPGDFGAQPRPGNVAVHDERPRRTHAHDPEAPQLRGQQCWAEPAVATHVDPLEEDGQRHEGGG
jgi:hypothetical protein